jgi:hypothetical protein
MVSESAIRIEHRRATPMALFEDEMAPLSPSHAPDQHTDFQIAWLHRRVENLEAIVYELLRDRVTYELTSNYMETVSNPGAGQPSSAILEGRGAQIARLIGREPPSGYGWPPKK